jgi:hypothetical protein
MPDPTRPCEEISLCGELSCDSKLKITKDLVTQTQDHTAPLNSQLKITQQLLTHPNSSESRYALGRAWRAACARVSLITLFGLRYFRCYYIGHSVLARRDVQNVYSSVTLYRLYVTSAVPIAINVARSHRTAPGAGDAFPVRTSRITDEAACWLPAPWRGAAAAKRSQAGRGNSLHTDVDAAGRPRAAPRARANGVHQICRTARPRALC